MLRRGEKVALVGPNGYDLRQSYQAAGLLSWDQPLDVEPNRSKRVEIPLTPNGGPVAPGIYYLWVNTSPNTRQDNPHFVVASNVITTAKPLMTITSCQCMSDVSSLM